MENKEKEVDNVGHGKLNTAIAFVVITAVSIFTIVVALTATIQSDFNKVEGKFLEDFTLPSVELWERVPDLYIYPWSEYHKHSTRQLSQEQGEFLRGKKVAECMVDMANYDGILIKDKESAVSLLYDEAHTLLTDNDEEYYVWNKIQVEGIYLFAMVNMNGEIFSFHYVTDMECDGQEAVRYVTDSFEDMKAVYEVGDEYSMFSSNRQLFLKSISRKLEEYKNLDTSIFYKNIDLTKKPTINEENGNLILVYSSETKENYFLFLYLDCKTKKVSGYHLTLNQKNL